MTNTTPSNDNQNTEPSRSELALTLQASPASASKWRRRIPFLWLALSAGWAVVLFVTDVPAWPLAIWVAATIGPITVLQRVSTTQAER